MTVIDIAAETEIIQRYRSALISSALLRDHPSIRHGITGKVAGSAPAEGNIGYSAPRGVNAAWQERQRWALAAGIDPRRLSTVHQVHGRDVIGIGLDRRGHGGPLGSTSLGKADAVMTATPGVAVMTLHADCLPIILVDPDVPAVCAIHAGWRGTVVNVVEASIEAMVREYGADPARMIALIGPGMRSCCYEVGDEVVADWRTIAQGDADIALLEGPRRWHFDLSAANRLLFQRAGVSADRIDDQSHCTHCNGDRWFSHRLQGPDTGRFAAMAGIAPADLEDVQSWA